MDNLENNVQILRASGGFVELPMRKLWVNRDRRLVISEEALRDHDSHWLESRLLEHILEEEFRFYTNHAVPHEVHGSVLDQLGLSNLIDSDRGRGL